MTHINKLFKGLEQIFKNWILLIKDFIISIYLFFYNISQKIFIFLELYLPKVLEFLIKYFIIIWCVAMFSFMTMYYFTPQLFKLGLSYLDYKSNNLSIIELNEKNLKEKEKIIEQLAEELNKLKHDKHLLQESLGKAIGEKDGIKQSISNQQTNWWMVIGTIAGVTTISLAGMYFLLYGDGDGSFFRPVLDYITLTSNNNNNFVESSITKLGKGIDKKFVDITSSLTSILNSVNSIEKDNS